MAIPILESLGLSGTGVICLIGAGGKTSLMFRLANELAEAGSRVLSTTTTNVHFPSKEQSAVTLVADTAQNLAARSVSFLKMHRHLSAGSLHVKGTGKLKGFSAPVIDAIWHAGCFDWVIVEADGARQLPIKASDTHEPVMPGVTTAVIHVTGLDALDTPLDEAHVHRSAIFSCNTGLALGSRVDIPAIAGSCVLEIQKACALAGSDPAAVVWLNKADDPGRVTAGHAIAARLKKDRQCLQKKNVQQGKGKSLIHHNKAFPWPGRVVIASLSGPDPIKDVVVL